MNISGFQKLSLVDYPEKICANIFTQGCIFRCSYCHNPDLIQIKKIPKANTFFILECIRARKKFIDGVCITGGEPTLQTDLVDFIKKIKEMGLLVKLDTSGINPKMVEKILQEDLVDYIAMDIKSPWHKYSKIVNIQNKKAIQNCQTTMSLLQSSSVDHEFRTTVFPEVHTEGDFFEMAGYLQNYEKYYIQNIRYEKTLDKNIDKTKKLDVKSIIGLLEKAFPYIQIGER